MRLSRIIIILSIFIIVNSPVYESIEVQAAENESKIKINEHLANMTEVRLNNQSAENVEQADLMLSRLNAVDPRVLENVDNRGATLILSDLPLTELPEFSDLKGVVPRGHTDTWDEIPGLGGFESYVRVGASDPGIENNHGDVNLELHEFGHMVDNFLVEGETISHQDEFSEIHKKEASEMFPDEPYFQYVEEYFAEAFAYYYLSDDTYRYLQERAPETAAFIENMHNKIFTVVDLKSKRFVLEWDDFNADRYEVRVDGDSYDTTSSTRMEIEGLEPNTQYHITINSLDRDGNNIDTTYTEVVHTDHEQDINTETLKTLLIEANKIDNGSLSDELKKAIEDGQKTLEEVQNETVTQEDVDNVTEALKAAYKYYQPRILEDTTTKSETHTEKNNEENSNVTKKSEYTVWIIILSVFVVLIILAITYLYFTGREIEEYEKEEDKNNIE